MNSKTLIIKNFGPVTNAEIEIRRFNLFIGEQSIGKSTIAKLITLFSDYLEIFSLFYKNREGWITLLEKFDFNPACLDNYVIKYRESHNNINIQIDIDSNSVGCHLFKDGIECFDAKDTYLNIFYQKPLFQLFEIPNESSSYDDKMRAFVNQMTNALYIPAERIVSSLVFNLLPALNIVDEQVPKTITRFIAVLNNAKSAYNGQNIGLLDVDYKKSDDKDLVVLKNGKELQLKNCSSGMQSVIPLILSIRYGVERKQYESFVVEEPECNLFPDKQVELLNFLISNLYKNNRMLTITTHSPYILSALNNLLYASKLSSKLSDTEALNQIISSENWISASDCSIYSLGESINGGEYCVSIMDNESGLVDFNYLDGVSITMGDKFTQMQKLYLAEIRKSNKK